MKAFVIIGTVIVLMMVSNEIVTLTALAIAGVVGVFGLMRADQRRYEDGS